MIQVPGDATAVGITMLAGLGVGVYRNPGEAVAAACHPAEPVLPDHANQDRYHALYERYRAVVASDLALARHRTWPTFRARIRPASRTLI